MKPKLLGLLLLLSACRPATSEVVTVYAAASTREAVEAVLQTTKIPTRVNAAASSVLARQIEAEAPAQVFISADERWMDHLEARGRLTPGTRGELMQGQLVLIEPTSTPTGAMSLQARLRAAPRIAMGDPEHVPAGRYAQAALTQAGLWASARPKIVATANVRGALALVARGEVPLGVVYATDARLSNHVRVVQVLALPPGQRVRYPIAAVGANASPNTQEVLRHLRSEAAQAIFRRYGFEAAAP